MRQAVLQEMYAAFNARDIDGVFRQLHPDVAWANGMEGGHVHGLDDIRAYWTRQWQVIDPSVTPEGFAADEAGRTVVTVHQVVKDMEGALLADIRVFHAYTFDGDLVTRMDILD